nr:hypothetical protein [Tanacetum cinerariifolium]
DNDDEDDDDDDDGDNNDDAESDDHDDANDDERTEPDSDEIPDPNLTNVDQTEYREEKDVLKELYEDVNVNLEKGDAEMIDTNQRSSEQLNVSQESGFEQEEEDAHVTLTPVFDAQKVDEPVQSSSVSSDFISKFLNLENPFLTDNKIASLMETSAPRATVNPEIAFGFTTTTPPLPLTTNQPQTAYAVAASVSKFKLKKILIDKMKANNSINRTDTQKNLYNALVKSYNFDKDIITSYGDVVLLKRGRDDQDKDEDPSEGQDKKSKEKKSSSTSKDASKSQNKSSGKSVHREEPSHTVEESRMHQDQEFITEEGDNDEQPVDKGVTKADSFKKPERPPTPNPDWSTCKSITELEYYLEECSKATTERLDWHNPKNKPYPFGLRKPLSLIQDHRGRQIIPKDYFINKDLEYLKGGDSSRRYLTSVTKTKAATYELKWIEDLVLELRRIITVTRLTIMKKYDYGHLEETEVRRDDQQLYTFKEGDFKRLRLQDIEDMLLLLVQQKLTNLTIDERNKTAYTSNSDPHGIIYMDSFKRKRLMRIDEIHKFSDGTLNDVRTAIHDITAGIRMEYMPMRK